MKNNDSSPNFKRILLKISGEVLAGKTTFCPQVLNRISQEIKDVVNMGVQVAIVIGGGNIFRGNAGEAQGIDRATADHMGMLATVMNALALQNCMKNYNLHPRVMTAINMNEIAEPYTRRRAFHHLENSRVVIFASGIGVPFFSTDTAGVLRACEINCDAIFKGTKVDGVFEDDPHQKPDSEFYTSLSYQSVLTNELKVMDATAVSLAKENNLPIIVFNIQTPGQLAQTVCGQGRYTTIS